MSTQSSMCSSASDGLPTALISPSDSELDADIKGGGISVSSVHSVVDSMSTKMSAGK